MKLVFSWILIFHNQKHVESIKLINVTTIHFNNLIIYYNFYSNMTLWNVYLFIYFRNPVMLFFSEFMI